MKKVIIAVLVVLAVFPMAFANGNGEKQTTINGVAVITVNADGTNNLAIQTKEGKMIQVAISSGDLARLQIRDQEQLRVKGVYLGETKETQTQERVFARTMTMAGKTAKLQEPVQLTEQERAQVRAYEDEQKATQAQTRTQAGNNSGSGNRSGSSSGSGSGNRGGSGGSSGGGGGGGGGKKIIKTESSLSGAASTAAP